MKFLANYRVDKDLKIDTSKIDKNASIILYNINAKIHNFYTSLTWAFKPFANACSGIERTNFGLFISSGCLNSLISCDAGSWNILN